MGQREIVSKWVIQGGCCPLPAFATLVREVVPDASVVPHPDDQLALGALRVDDVVVDLQSEFSN